MCWSYDSLMTCILGGAGVMIVCAGVMYDMHSRWSVCWSYDSLMTCILGGACAGVMIV